MIFVYYAYIRKRDKKLCHGVSMFDNINKACRFIHMLKESKDKWFEYYSTDDPEINEELYQKL